MVFLEMVDRKCTSHTTERKDPTDLRDMSNGTPEPPSTSIASLTKFRQFRYRTSEI